jgi:hypothetical protein
LISTIASGYGFLKSLMSPITVCDVHLPDRIEDHAAERTLSAVQDLSHLRLSPLTNDQSAVRLMWPPRYQNAATGSQKPASRTRRNKTVSPGEVFGIYPPGSEVSADYPTSGNESTTKGIGVIVRLHALDLSCCDGSSFRDQGAAAAISRTRYIECLQSHDCQGLSQLKS